MSGCGVVMQHLTPVISSVLTEWEGWVCVFVCLCKCQPTGMCGNSAFGCCDFLVWFCCAHVID